jgi:hypothetical protein
MSIHCPNCGVPVPDESLNTDLMVVNCAACGKVSQVAKSPLAPLVAPDGVTVAEEGSDLVIRWSWLRTGLALGLPFGLIAFTMFTWNDHSPLRDPSLFSIPFIAVPLGAIYVGTAGLLNATTVRLSRGRLEISHGPVPWRGVSVEVADLKRLHAQRHVRKGKNGSQHVTWSLDAELEDGRDLVLISGLNSEETAEFFDKKIEAALGIVDHS